MPWQRVTLILELLQHKKKLRRPQVLVPALFNLLARYGMVCKISCLLAKSLWPIIITYLKKITLTEEENLMKYAAAAIQSFSCIPYINVFPNSIFPA